MSTQHWLSPWTRRRKQSLSRVAPRRRPMLEVLEDRLVLAAAYALSGSSLLSFDTDTPGTTSSIAISGVDMSESLVGIDFRPQNGHLYGLGVNAAANTASLYDISTRTGLATAVGAVSSIAFTTNGAAAVDLPDPATVGYGVDFNPAADRFRVVVGSLNFRVNPNTGGPIDGDNTGLTSDGVSGINPDGPILGATTTVDATAYTNNQQTTVATPFTTQYTLDAASNMLFIQNPPNVGTQTSGQTVTLGGPTLDFSGVNGFDIPAGGECHGQ